MKKRLIAFLLVLIMVLGMLPVSAFAADGDATKYTYTLYYKWNDGTDRTWNTDDTSPTAETSFTHYVNTATLPRNGYQHSGWADEANATTARYTGGEPIVLNKDNPTKTIYAIWLPIFELHYNANGGTGAPDSQTYTSYSATSTQATFTSRNQIPTKDGYTFKGWADSAAATTAQYQPGGTIAVNHADSPKTVYAVWEKNAAPIEYTVTYYKNDGSANDLFYKTSDWGEPSEKFNIYWGKPTRDGYDFVGWAETRDATEAKYASGGAGGKQSWIKLDGPKVLYAVWQEAGLEPEAPRSPSDCKDQLKTNKIKPVCVDGNHPGKMITFADVSYGSDWSMGDTCKLNFYAKDAALKYPGHAPKNPEERIYVTFKWVNDKTDANGKYLPGEWVMVETTAAVVELVDTGVEAPSQPTTAQLGNIKVTCRTNAEHSSEFPVARCMGTTVGTVTFDSVKKQWYIDTAPMTTQLASRYDSWKGYAEGTHRLVNPDAELNARFYYDGEKWYTEDTLAIDVCCGAVSEIPGKPDMNQFLGNVLIRCTTDCSTHAEKGRKNIYSNTRDSSMYTEVLDGNGDAIWKDNGGVWTYQIKLIRAKFVEAYSNNRFIKYAHTDTAPNEETILTWKYRNGAWELIKLPGYTEVATIIEVKCAETPVKPEKPTALDGSFAIVCKNNEATHAYKADYIATPSQYTISDVQKDEQGYYVTATVTVAPNLVAYNKATRVEHRLVDEQDATLTITFRYDTEATVDGNRKWKQQGDLPVVEVICKPKAPTADELKKLEMAVQVKCVVDASQQHTAAYGLLGEYDEDYLVGEPRKDGDDWLCDISYDPNLYVAEFNKTFPNPKHVQNDEKIVPVTLIWAGGSWQLKTQGLVNVTEEYTVTYTDGVENEEVFADQVYSDLRKDSATPAFNGTPTRTGYTFAGWEPEVAETVTETVTYVAKWTPVEPKAPTAEELEKLEMAVQVKCVVDDSQQHTEAYGLLGEYDEDYFVGEPRKDGDDWLCDISYYPERYVAEFNTTFQNLKHVQNDEKIVPVTLIWAGGSWQLKTQGLVNVTEEYTVTYTDGVENEEVFADQVYSDLRKDSATPAFNGTPTRTGYTFAGWEPEVAATVTQTVTYVAKWEAKKANVHLMIFKSGDLSKPIVDVPYAADKLAGDTIDLTKIDPSSYLDFDFEIDGGWYDDGMFNSYKRYLDGLQDKPAGLEKLLITGNWQNLKLIVTELVPVVYFDSLESLTAYQNDHSKTEGILRTTKARVGSALPTADAPTATRDGYTFTFWSREGQTMDVTDQTVNGWTNLVANWKVTPHNIYAYARLNSYFAPLTTSELDTPVTLNEATLSRLGLGSYNSLGYISIGSFTFDAMPLTSDLYFGDDAELSAVAEKLATDIALETGVSDKIAEKIAWTALYKTVNEEDMEPGYPAEAGYQLSGNLNLASVTFRAGAENVENMPAVNYTYDDGAIDFYDFYFAGDTITLPTTEPTREGYSFKGWSVEVIPA